MPDGNTMEEDSCVKFKRSSDCGSSALQMLGLPLIVRKIIEKGVSKRLDGGAYRKLKQARGNPYSSRGRKFESSRHHLAKKEGGVK